MKNKLLFLFLVLSFSACTQKPMPTASCPALFCAISDPVMVTYVDNSNNGVVVKNFTVIDLRTDKLVPTSGTSMLNPGTYVVANISDAPLFLATGDSLQVSATYSLTNQTKIVGFKISGGTCTCGVIKISGPDTVKFN